MSRIRAEYVRLRNVDPAGDAALHRGAWEALASRMRTALVQPSSHPDISSTRLMATDTHLRLYRATRQRSYLATARAILNPVLAESTSGAIDESVQAQALVLSGDLALYSGFKDSATQSYQQAAGLAIEPEATRARQRLQGMSNGTYQRFLPSLDGEVPKLIEPSQSTVRAGAPVVVIDPGHGGEDAGAVSAPAGAEKDISLDVARRVKVLLERRHGVKVHLTREDDRFVPLARRTAFANRKQAAAFISLHVNASVAHDAEGLEVYYLDNTNDDASRKLAERENGVVQGQGVDDLSFMLSDLIQTGKLEDSIVLSRSLDNSVKRNVIGPNRGLRSLGVKKGPFFVLVGAHMPCSLIEMFFIDHPLEGKMLQKDSFRSSLAIGIADGIQRFLAQSL